MAEHTFGGYACEFIDVIPKELQTECSICLHVLKDPHMVDCCGNRFCRTCIDTHLSKNDNYCPLCKHHLPLTVADKQLARTLRQKRVSCTHREEGCKWTGELSLLDEHLDFTKRMEGCSFKSLMCSYCDLSFRSSHIESHELRCLKKPVVCEYCDEFECLQYELAQHWEFCDLYPILCSKGCGAMVTRLGLDEHIEDWCSMTIVDCEFAYTGCEVKVPRKNMREHMDQSVSDHLVMLRKKYSRLVKKYEKEREENEQLKVELEAEKNKRYTDEQRGQVLVENLSFGTDEQMVRSRFGQFGCLHTVKFYSSSLTALVKYQNDDSIHNMFQTYNSSGIKLRGAQLKCTLS